MTVSHLSLDPAALAALACCWVEDNVPAPFDSGMAEMILRWRDGGDLPQGALWRAIADRLLQSGCLDAEADACRMALSLQPNQPFFQLRLGDVLRRSAKDDEARQVLRAIRGSADIRCDALLAQLRLRDAPTAALHDSLESLLLDMGGWTERHRLLIERMVEIGAKDRAVAFIQRWTEKWPVAASNLAELGMAAMQTGSPRLARTLFTPVWSALARMPDSIVPDFDGTLPPYGQTEEAALIRRIDAAFALDEADLPRIALPEAPSPRPGLRVTFLTFEHGPISNDLADHFAGSASAVGVDLALYYDRTLTVPDDALGDDAHVAARLEMFIAELERTRPDVLMIDAVSILPARGLNPGIAAGLKARFGFRLVCVFRDAHSHAMGDLDRWLPVCDTMVTFDPLSPVLEPQRAPLNAKVMVAPVPSAHGPFLQRQPRDLGLSFVGSVKHLGRAMPLSVLMTEDLDATVVFGAARAAVTPDTTSYARVLNRSRAVLNISCHGPGIHLVTGRVWETIAAGAVLLEQDNPATARLFAPYRHYLPWTNMVDLVQAARFVQHRPDQAERIAQAAQDWAGRHYHPHRFWSAILAPPS